MRSHPSSAGCLHSPRPRGSARPLRSRRVAPAHECARVCTHLRGDLRGLQYAELQSWEENTDVSLLLEAASLQSTFPSGFSFSLTPFISRAPRDAVTEFGAIVQAGRGRGESQLCSHGREQQNSLKWTVLELFCQPTRQSNMQMLSIRLPAACCGATTRA